MQKQLVGSLSLWILLAIGHTITTSSAQEGEAVSCPLNELPYPRPEPDYTGKLVRDLSPFSAALEAYTDTAIADREALVSGKTIPELQTLLDSGGSTALTSVDLVVYYLERIQRYDVDKLNSVLELNPEVLQTAQALDDERAAGNIRGPMHGIPVLLKDNIAVGGGTLHTAAGSAALLEWQPDRDAFLVSQLRAAGAIVLGKANLSEWANYMDPCMPNGFSTNGGQTQNPYGPFETYGSSSGSAVSVSADLVTVSVGSETQGSIIAPATINSAVALKTSRGLVSGDYIIPLLPWQDVAGPMGRSVVDVATLLGAMTGVDDNDPNTQASINLTGVEFTDFQSEGVRVGIVVWTEDAILGLLSAFNETVTEGELAANLASFAEPNAEARATGQLLSDAGMTVVEVPGNLMPGGVEVGPALEYGFGEAINEFLSALGDDAPFTSLSEIVDYNRADLANRAPYGQGHLENSLNPSLTSEEYNSVRESNQAKAREAIDALFQSQNIDVVVSSVSQLYAPAGYPALTVPSGYDENGLPQSVVFVGGFMSEPQLLSVGYAYEQATQARVPPDLAAEPWTACSGCVPLGVCWSPEGCSLRDGTTGNWTGEAAQCNEVPSFCEECFPDSVCYNLDTSTASGSGDPSPDGDSSTSSASGSTIIALSWVWAVLMAGLMAMF